MAKTSKKVSKVAAPKTVTVESVALVEVEPNLDTMTFAQDHRKINPGLHMLYTKLAVPHLVEIDKAIRTFNNFNNLNMLGMLDALFTERKKLVTENAAYAEADDILKTIRKHGGVRKKG